MSVPKNCINGMFCVEGSLYPRACPYGKYATDDKKDCQSCPKGRYCWPEIDATTGGAKNLQDDLCSAGYVC